MKDTLAFPIMLKKPSGYLPVAMSLAALAIVLVSLALFGVTHEADEGATAHLWQLLMAGQVPIIGFFMLRWLAAGSQACAVGAGDANRRRTGSDGSSLVAAPLTNGWPAVCCNA